MLIAPDGPRLPACPPPWAELTLAFAVSLETVGSQHHGSGHRRLVQPAMMLKVGRRQLESSEAKSDRDRDQVSRDSLVRHIMVAGLDVEPVPRFLSEPRGEPNACIPSKRS